MAEMKSAKSEHKASKKLSHLEVRKAKGGHVVTHHHVSDGQMYHKPVDHVFGDGEGHAMLAHVGKMMGVEAEESPQEEASESAREEAKEGE